MTEAELRHWLGLPLSTAGVAIKPEVVEAMADVPWPVTDKEHVEAFTTYLRACGVDGTVTFEGNAT